MEKLKNIGLQSGSLSSGAQAILESAQILFSEKGFDAVSLNEIAFRAGTSKANIFHHFKSKKALYQAVLKSACEEFSVLVENVLHKSGALDERLHHFLHAHIENMQSHGVGTRLILNELLKNEGGQELAETLVGDHFASLVQVLDEAKERGELREDLDLAGIATALIAANVFFFQAQHVLRHLSEVDFADDAEQFTRMLADMFLNGIKRSDKKAK